MSQLSLYLDDAQYQALKERARAEGVSLSKYAARLIENDAADTGWPQGFWDLYGAIDDPAFCALPDPISTEAAPAQ